MDWPEDREDWFMFSEDRNRGRAREWLADVGYRPAVRSSAQRPEWRWMFFDSPVYPRDSCD